MTAWMATGPAQTDGVVGGDGAGQSYSVRYTRADIPGAIITSYWYAFDESERYGDDPTVDEYARTGWDVENMVELLICTDPENPGDTEVWSTTDYRNPTEMVFDNEAAAQAYAQQAAQNEQVDHYDWDGTPLPE